MVIAPSVAHNTIRTMAEKWELKVEGVEENKNDIHQHLCLYVNGERKCSINVCEIIRGMRIEGYDISEDWE